jgi:hypothetical protein
LVKRRLGNALFLSGRTNAMIGQRNNPFQLRPMPARGNFNMLHRTVDHR